MHAQMLVATKEVTTPPGGKSQSGESIFQKVLISKKIQVEEGLKMTLVAYVEWRLYSCYYT